MIDISILNKAEVLVALYNNARPQGMGWIDYIPEDMQIDEARALLEEHHYFDYVNGRVMKVNLSKDTLNPALYDRDNGEGAAEQALAHLFDYPTNTGG